jgi:hypothetical protein
MPRKRDDSYLRDAILLILAAVRKLGDRSPAHPDVAALLDQAELLAEKVDRPLRKEA